MALLSFSKDGRVFVAGGSRGLVFGETNYLLLALNGNGSQIARLRSLTVPNVRAAVMLANGHQFAFATNNSIYVFSITRNCVVAAQSFTETVVDVRGLKRNQGFYFALNNGALIVVSDDGKMQLGAPRMCIGANEYVWAGGQYTCLTDFGS